MAYTRGPYAEVECGGCHRMIVCAISAKNAAADLDEYRDKRDFRCAQCSSENASVVTMPRTLRMPTRDQE
jgi:hypothetical protein